MTLPSSYQGWPHQLRDYLSATRGEPVAVEDLGGMSLGSVSRVQFLDGSLIVKCSPHDREFNFYRSVAGTLNQIGVPTPHLEWSGLAGGSYWLVLDDIPEGLPSTQPDQWRADPRVVETLCRLHAATPGALLDRLSLFEPQWTPEMSEAALSLFPPDTACELAAPLESLRRECQPLFAPQCFISGDPNPRNWGVRRDGTAVLFDWERFARGTPALDLAIIVPGLGDRPTFQRVARDYIQACARIGIPSHASVEEFARDLSLAKAWTVVEFLANHARNPTTATKDVTAWLVDSVPRWVVRVAGEQFEFHP